MTGEQERLHAVRLRTAQQNLATTWSAGELAMRLIAGSDAADDCAILDVAGRGALVVGSDYIRGAGFRLFGLGLLDYYDLGWYLTMANVSDVAAMGAVPVGLLTVIRYPKDMADEDFDAVLAGIADACGEVGANPLGGDIGGAERLFLAGAAFGICESGTVLRRDGARPGDLLAVTGSIGAPAAALVWFDRYKSTHGQLPNGLEERLVAAWRRPQARVDEGRLLAEVGANACQDVSDGLRDTIEQLCRASGLGCRVVAADLPLDPGVHAVAERADLDPVALALGASVDFQLACALPPAALERCRRQFEEIGAELHVIGEFTEDRDLLLVRDGATHELPGVSWDHSTQDPAASIADASRRAKPRSYKPM